MEERRNSLLQMRTLVDIVIGGICIILLLMMLEQLNTLQKIESEMDRLRATVEARKASQVADKKRVEPSGEKDKANK